MKVSREQAARNRERILDAAAQLFRERGFEGIGVADLMKEAGLTHGGFYGHFSSKDDLIAQASARELTRSLAHWSKLRASVRQVIGCPRSPTVYLTSSTSRQSGRGLCAGRAGAGRVATRSAGAARCDRLRAFHCRSLDEAGSEQVQSSKKTEGHQHVRNIGRRNGSRARGR